MNGVSVCVGLCSIHDLVMCGVVWCGVVWCGVVWCGVVWCGVVWCGVVLLLCIVCRGGTSVAQYRVTLASGYG